MSVALFICYGSYTRKAHLTGIVMPSSELVKITPHNADYITQLTASEGQHVVTGESFYHFNLLISTGMRINEASCLL
nr:hypothetical protein [Klebsiella aerogenes]